MFKNIYIFFRDIIRLPFATIFGTRFVRLYDKYSEEGEYRVRMVRRHKGYYGAWRVGLGVRFVVLKDNGLIDENSCSYVERWEPHSFFDFEDNRIMKNDFPKFSS